MTQKPEIIVTKDMYAPEKWRYIAMEDEYEGVNIPYGSGPTPLAAIVDLLDQLDGVTCTAP